MIIRLQLYLQTKYWVFNLQLSVRQQLKINNCKANKNKTDYVLEEILLILLRIEYRY